MIDHEQFVAVLLHKLTCALERKKYNNHVCSSSSSPSLLFTDVRLSAVMFVVYTLVFLLWVVIYQTKKSELQGLSILEVKNHLS